MPKAYSNTHRFVRKSRMSIARPSPTADGQVDRLQACCIWGRVTGCLRLFQNGLVVFHVGTDHAFRHGTRLFQNRLEPLQAKVTGSNACGSRPLHQIRSHELWQIPREFFGCIARGRRAAKLVQCRQCMYCMICRAIRRASHGRIKSTDMLLGFGHALHIWEERMQRQSLIERDPDAPQIRSCQMCLLQQCLRTCVSWTGHWRDHFRMRIGKRPRPRKKHGAAEITNLEQPIVLANQQVPWLDVPMNHSTPV
mmetsp:Transcript_5007/g.11656  ORF Transcript_5007/g.11656 Transcript_5007/m.11656 type:complete len:252 (+) Transcript_5007:44-799(+)